MRKLFSIVLAALLCLGSLSGCGSSAPVTESNQVSQSAEPAAPAETQESNQAQPAEPAAPADGKEWPQYDGKIVLGLAVRTFSNPYHVKVSQGAEMLVEDLKAAGYNIEYQTILDEGSDNKQISDLKALIARSGQDLAMYIEPQNAPNGPIIADICDEAKVPWTHAWTPGEDVFPTDYEYWVAYHTPDDIQAGYNIAVEMFKGFETPGKGKILALQGPMGNTAAENRKLGLQKALEEYPDVELLELQPADWQMDRAQNITETWLSKYDDIDGIWCGNDTMGLGVIVALKAKGLNGKIGVTGVDGTQEAIDAIKAGDMVCTSDVNGLAQGYYASAWAIAAKIGLLDYKSLTPGERMFTTATTLITADNVDEVTNAVPQFDYREYRSFAQAPADFHFNK